MPKFYRKKPVIIQAALLSEKNFGRVLTWCDGQGLWSQDLPFDEWRIDIHTLEGVMSAKIGDYIIRGVAGEFYPCRADIFLDTYESLEQWVASDQPGPIPGEVFHETHESVEDPS